MAAALRAPRRGRASERRSPGAKCSRAALPDPWAPRGAAAGTAGASPAARDNAGEQGRAGPPAGAEGGRGRVAVPAVIGRASPSGTALTARDPPPRRGTSTPPERPRRGRVPLLRRPLTILLRAGLGLGADSGSPPAGQLLLVVRRRRWRGLSPSIGAELGGCGGPGGEKPGEDVAPGAEERVGRGGRR